MKKNLFASLLFLLSLSPLSQIVAQKDAKINIELSSDTIGLNNTLEVAITVENAKVKRFTPPSFEGFRVQGPSTSTSMSIINGDMTQSSTYTFYLTPREKGAFKIGSASVDIDGTSRENREGGTLKTDETEIIVVENFDPEIKPQKQQRSLWGDDSFFGRPMIPQPPRVPEKTKKKYNTEKI